MSDRIRSAAPFRSPASSLHSPLLHLALVTFTLLLLGWGALAPLQAAAQTNDAIIVVQSDDYRTVVRRISFTTPISGLRALESTGLQIAITSTSFGPLVCSIDGVGCPLENCFCSSSYWAYSYWDGADWVDYQVGAGSSLITTSGAIEGWRWGEFGSPKLPATTSVAALTALEWLADQANTETGSYGSPGANAEVLLAFGANNQPEPITATAGVLRGQARAYAALGAASAGKLAVALRGADSCLPMGVMTPRDHFSPTLGSFSTQSGPQSWAILGALAVGEELPASAVDDLIAQAQSGGGWGWSGTGGVDTNTTALAIQAIIAAGRPITTPVIVQALARLKTAQREDGGFSYGFGDDDESDANSTAYVVQALIAAQEDPRGPAWTQNGLTPFDFLLARRQPDGALEWMPGTGSNALATTQAIPALLGRTHPLAVGLAACPGALLPIITTSTPISE